MYFFVKKSIWSLLFRFSLLLFQQMSKNESIKCLIVGDMSAGKTCTGCPIEHRQNRAKIIGNIGILATKIQEKYRKIGYFWVIGAQNRAFHRTNITCVFSDTSNLFFKLIKTRKSFTAALINLPFHSISEKQSKGLLYGEFGGH